MIEFGPDNRPFTTIFASGTGHDQAYRRSQSYLESLVPTSIGKCLKCKSKVMCNPGWVGVCTRCSSAAMQLHLNRPAVATMSITPAAPDPAPIRDPEPPLDRHGLDGLEEW